MLKSGHRIHPVTGREQQKQIDEFKAYGVGTVRLQPDGWFFTSPFIEDADKLYDFQFKPTDVVIVTYPKCGTTWTQEILWTMLNNPNLDHPHASLPIVARSPFLEFDFLNKSVNQPEGGRDELINMFCKQYPDRNPADGVFYQMAELTPEPRLIKTHLPLSLLHPSLIDTCKIVYVARQPKDVVVSYHHHSKLLKVHGFVGTLDSFVDNFINGNLMYGPYWTHMKEVWQKRHHPNVHFCFYEDMKADPKREYLKFQTFLGTKLSEKQIDDVIEYTSFSAMKARDNLIGDMAKSDETPKFMNAQTLKEDGGFFRKGVTGDWKNKLSQDHVQKIKEWTKKHTQDFGPDFKYTESNKSEDLSFYRKFPF